MPTQSFSVKSCSAEITRVLWKGWPCCVIIAKASWLSPVWLMKQWWEPSRYCLASRPYFHFIDLEVTVSVGLCLILKQARGSISIDLVSSLKHALVLRLPPWSHHSTEMMVYRPVKCKQCASVAGVCYWLMTCINHILVINVVTVSSVM